jgi:hypothetical protein
MTAKIANFGVDLYKLSINSGGTIDLDTGSGGTVIVRGDFTVEGTTTVIESTEIAVSDRTFTLNYGETGAGVSTGDNTAGITIDRGSLTDVNILYDENLNWLKSSGSGFLSRTGAFVLQDSSGSNNSLVGLYTNFIGTFDNQNLILFGEGPNGSPATPSPVVTVTGTVDYEKSIWNYTGSQITPDLGQPDGLVLPNDPDILVNVQALKDYVLSFSQSSFQSKLASPAPAGNTRVEVFSTLAGDIANTVDISLAGTLSTTFTETGIFLNNVKINNNTISSVQTDSNLDLSANGTGSVSTSYPINLEKTSEPTMPDDGVKVYADDEGDGGTGIYFINEDGTSDELISRTKALLLSIIF